MTTASPGVIACSSRTSTTRATRSTSARSPRRCAPSTRRSTPPASSCRSTAPTSRRAPRPVPRHAAGGVHAHDRAARRGAQRRDPRHPAGAHAHAPLLGQLRGAAPPRRPARGDPRPSCSQARRRDLLRARQPAARARVARLRGRRAARRQGPRPRRHRLDDELHRAPGPRRRSASCRFAELVGRERVIAEHRLRLRTFAGFAPVFPSIVYAKPAPSRRAPSARARAARPGPAWRQRRAPRAARRP